MAALGAGHRCDHSQADSASSILVTRSGYVLPGCPQGYRPGMPAYVIVETDITDPAQYEQYKAASPAAIAAGGGRFLVRGGEFAVLEGDWQPSRLVMLEFEDLEAAKRWYESEIYQEAKKLREGAARFRAIAVQGVD